MTITSTYLPKTFYILLLLYNYLLQYMFEVILINKIKFIPTLVRGGVYLNSYFCFPCTLPLTEPLMRQ